ncbi:Disease resistance protein L6 [Linum perenne]
MLPLPTGEYEVFLNFRGPDVRKSFADHLYNCLVRYKIRTFRDEEELQKGETIGPYLNQAIAESKIYIPIFTEGYASSKWCLQELAKMVNCWKTGGGGKGQHIILPVFYFIDPRDVRHPDSGSYKEAFEQYQLKHDSETILEWKEALQEVGKMKGWHVTEQDGQGDVVGKIFTEVESHLRDNYTLVTDELVGIDFQVEEIMKLLNLDSTSEKIIGIHGMGGIGKTTLAKGVYNKVSTRFERCCFLENIRETLSKNDGAVTLQNKLISTILRKDSHQVVNISDGMQVIRDRVCRYKVFIVLDDVDERFQFDDILGKLGYFSSDSRFLITTRDTRINDEKEFWMHDQIRDLGRAIVREGNTETPYKCSRIWSNTDAINMLKNREGTDSVEAFRVDMKGENLVLTSKEFKQFSRLRYLEVWNGRLRGNFKDVLPNIRWLRLYRCDSLPSGLNLKKLAILSLESCSVRDGWGGWNQHVFPSSLNYLDICYCMYTQRLPNIGNLTNLIGLRLTDVGIDKVPGLGELKLLETLTIESVPNLENLDGLENLVLLKEMSLQGCSVLEKLPSVAMLTKLHKLVIGTCPVLTEIYGVGELTESLSHLDINGCPSLKGMTLHSVVKLETLALTAPGSTSIIPPSLSVFNQLRRLTISSMSLRRFPDLSNMKHLRDLRIAYCHVLIEVPGLDTLYSLEFLDIRDCRSLRALPDLSDLVNLKNLDLTGCTQLDVIRGLERLEALEILYMSDCESIKELPNLSGLKNLRRLRLLNCGQLKEVNGLEELESLELFQKDKSLKAKYVMKHSKVSWWDRLVHP